MRRGTALTIVASAVAFATAVPPAQIRGKVSLARNRPVVGAIVLVEPERGGSLLLTASDLRGEFRVADLEEGVYRVTIRRDGFKPWTQDRLDVKPPFRTIVEATLEPAGAAAEAPPPAPSTRPAALRFAGFVREAEGAPAVSARLRLVRPDGALDPREAPVGEDGRVEIEALPAGRWNLEILAPGAIPLRAGLDLLRDTEFEISLVAQPPEYPLSLEDLMPPEDAVPPEGLR